MKLGRFVSGTNSKKVRRKLVAASQENWSNWHAVVEQSESADAPFIRSDYAGRQLYRVGRRDHLFQPDRCRRNYSYSGKLD